MTTLRNFNLEVAVAPGAFAYAYPASATRLIIPFASYDGHNWGLTFMDI